jgi:hypothetical protein
MSNRIFCLAAALALATGCKSERPAPANESPVTTELNPATQVDLARDLDDADRLATWTEVKHHWQGQKMRWTVTRQKLLCGSPTTCNVSAFPILRPATRGWMPALTMTPDQYARIAAGCTDPQKCELTFEGTLSDLVVSPQVATHLMFSDVTVLAAHS